MGLDCRDCPPYNQAEQRVETEASTDQKKNEGCRAAGQDQQSAWQKEGGEERAVIHALSIGPAKRPPLRV